MKTCVIFNPAARGEKAAKFRDHLSALSAECTLKPTLSAGGGRALAAEAVREGFEVVVAAGGDGTVNEVLNGIGDVPDGFARTRFAVLPLGTINVFARELRMPSDFTRAWAVIKQARETIIDLPQVEFTANEKTERRFFAQIAGAGWDSRAIELVNWEYKKKIGGLAYVWSGLQALARPLPQISVNDGTRTLTGELVIIGNGQFYGGNWRLFPLADLRDGILEISIFPKLDFERILRGTWGLFTNRLYETGAVQHLKAEKFTLSSSAQVPFHVEGENIGHLPATFSVQREALKVIIP
jgi:YegS/Rv2252/BmrU family lipid kinase